MCSKKSDYLVKLITENTTVAERYLNKIKIIKSVDPYALNEFEISYGLTDVPSVQSMDIVSYLVLTHSFYTAQQMKAFKSLSAYKYFEAGFLHKVGTKKIGDYCVMVGKVKHSQRANEKELKVWVITESDGGICSAHCTCMAGQSEVCSHVGAILFAAEYATKSRDVISCTDVKACWPVPSGSSAPNAVVSDMNWGKTASNQKSRSDIPVLEGDQLVQFLKEIEQEETSAGLMRIVEPFATKISESNASDTHLLLLFDIFHENNAAKSYEELLNIAKDIKFDISEEDTYKIEEATRDQSQCSVWYIQRAGRITASKFKVACKTKISQPSISLIKSICYPTKVIFTTTATNWGLTHENVAVEAYSKNTSGKHTDLIINEVGFIINKKWPQFGASPDRLVFCECCLGGCLEVKCPYLLHKNKFDILEYVNLKSSCLVKDSDEIKLNRNHVYYFQVQMQLYVSELRYCDFVVWSPNVFFCERIYPDDDFWNEHSNIASQFHHSVILPELLGRYFTNKVGGSKTVNWCLCHGVDDGQPMIQCDNEDCETQWYHLKCINMTNIPDTQWYCAQCSNLK